MGAYLGFQGVPDLMGLEVSTVKKERLWLHLFAISSMAMGLQSMSDEYRLLDTRLKNESLR